MRNAETPHAASHGRRHGRSGRQRCTPLHAPSNACFLCAPQDKNTVEDGNFFFGVIFCENSIRQRGAHGLARHRRGPCPL